MQRDRDLPMIEIGAWKGLERASYLFVGKTADLNYRYLRSVHLLLRERLSGSKSW